MPTSSDSLYSDGKPGEDILSDEIFDDYYDDAAAKKEKAAAAQDETVTEKSATNDVAASKTTKAVVAEEEEEETRANTTSHNNSTAIPNGYFARYFKFMARNAWYHFWAAFIITVGLSAIGIIVGQFSVSVDNAGWTSRGTLIANRHTQAFFTQIYFNDLAYGDVEDWERLETTVQPGWESDGLANRRLSSTTNAFDYSDDSKNNNAQDTLSSERISADTFPPKRVLPFVMDDTMRRKLEESVSLTGCSFNNYLNGRILNYYGLWPLWKTKGGVSALDPLVIEDLCVAEQKTQTVLEDNGLCDFSCGSSFKCLPAYSLVLYARTVVGDLGIELSCAQLAEAWSAVRAEQEVLMKNCTDEIRLTYAEDETIPSQCGYFHPAFVDQGFGIESTDTIYTSSIFPNPSGVVEEMYDLAEAGKFDQASSSNVVSGAYDTVREDFVNFFVDVSVTNDMILAMGSAAITGTAILVHTRSPWLTFIGLFQIILSFPLAFFVYTFIARLDFFPFLNFIGVFVVFALGADDIFVAVDKWKNARIDHRNGTTEEIAAVALPDAAGAMFLTTTTTAVAFFGTAICPVAPLKCFAVFCGLLIVFDYFMCVVLVFPALCIYDKWLAKGNNCCCSLHVCKKHGESVQEFVDEDAPGEKPSLIRRILTTFYDGFHKVRWFMFAASIAGTIVSALFATALSLPTNSDVRLLSNSIQYEQNYEWRLNLFWDQLQESGGAEGLVIWGVSPADTGKHTDPKKWTQLVLDDTFDPSTTAAQEYFLGFCDRFFAQEFAGLIEEEYVCPINAFDLWLGQQASNPTSSLYLTSCNGAASLPMDPDFFNPCVDAYLDSTTRTQTMFLKSGVMEIMYVRFQQRIKFDSPFTELSDEWQLLEDFMKAERASAPEEASNGYHTSDDFWWFDTNGRMLQAAFGAAAIALGFSGFIVLVSSRSFVLTIFCILTIGFVLCSTTALLVASGWTLGFLESVCFAILIGISCDFVIHFGHAYAHQPGYVDRGERTKYALIRMGPSILAAAFTTICAAAVMLFTVISFFQQFALILFYTVIMATAGSFIVFLALTDCIGPAQPTYLFDKYFCKKEAETKEAELEPKQEYRVEAPEEVMVLKSVSSMEEHDA